MSASAEPVPSAGTSTAPVVVGLALPWYVTEGVHPERHRPPEVTHAHHYRPDTEHLRIVTWGPAPRNA